MIRRSHKKSKQGCAECKRGHKKCDESRPTCVNCKTAKKQCSYARHASSQSPNDRDFVPSTGHASLDESKSPHPSIASRTTKSSPRSQTPTTPHVEPYVNLLHLELFQNIVCNAIDFFDDSNSSSKEKWVATVIRYTFSYPYLMSAMLALSAFNLSIKHPSNSNKYLSESAILQAQALSLYNSSAPTANQDSIIPAFLFSAIIGLHFFCDTFSTPSPDLNTFLDRLVQSIRLLRGVRTMVGDSWEFIKNSDIKFLLQDEDGPTANRDDEVTRAFEDLRSNFSQSHTISAFESKVYCEAITSLIEVYNSQPLDRAFDGPPNPRIVTAWPILISAEYTDLLNQRKPEALIVMAYFSILVHSRREFWAVGDAGRFMLTAIYEYLGERGTEWLDVPKSMIFTR